MTHQSQRIAYYAAPVLEQRPRAEVLATPPIDWERVRKWLLPAVLLVAVVALYLVQSSFATTSELESARLMREHDLLVRQNLQLAADIAELEKPSRIRERALALGFVDANKSIRMTVPLTTEPETDAGSTSNPDLGATWQRLIVDVARRLSPASK